MLDFKKIFFSSYGKTALLLFLAIVILSGGIGSTYAYLKWSTAEVENNFTAEVSELPTVNENFTDNVKSDVMVSVGDTGYSVYVRTVILATWINSSGQIHAEAPVEGIDYVLSINTADWFKRSDGYYYYQSPVASGGSTTALITSCAPIKVAPDDGYTLNIQIIAQTIQSAGTTDDGTQAAVTNAWGVAIGPDKKLIND